MVDQQFSYYFKGFEDFEVREVKFKSEDPLSSLRCIKLLMVF